jgi:hypothetical protein
MNFLNTLIQRIGLFCAFGVPGYLLMLYSATFGPNLVMPGVWGLVISLLACVVTYLGFYAMVSRFARGRLANFQPGLVIQAVLDICVPTAVFTVIYELEAALFTKLITIGSHIGLVLWLFGLFIVLAGYNSARSYQPKSDTQ